MFDFGMKLEVNISKKYVFAIIVAILVLAGVFGVYAAWDSNKAMFHSADDVKVSIAGDGDYSLNEAVSLGKLGGIPYEILFWQVTSVNKGDSNSIFLYPGLIINYAPAFHYSVFSGSVGYISKGHWNTRACIGSACSAVDDSYAAYSDGRDCVWFEAPSGGHKAPIMKVKQWREQYYCHKYSVDLPYDITGYYGVAPCDASFICPI